VNTAETVSVIVAVGAILILASQAFWIARELDGLAARIDRLDKRLERLEDKSSE